MRLSIGESRDRRRKRLVRCWMLPTTLALMPTVLPAQNYSELLVLHAAAQGEGFAGMLFGGAAARWRSMAIDGDLAVVSELHLGAAKRLPARRR